MERSGTAILCGLSGEVLAIHYGDAAVGMSEMIVYVVDLIDFNGPIIIKATDMSGNELELKPELIHRIDELPGNTYFSVIEWLASYGLPIKLRRRGNTWKYQIDWDLI